MKSGLSKKFCAGAVSIGAVAVMADGAVNPFPYAVVIGVIGVVCIVSQAVLDFTVKKDKD